MFDRIKNKMDKIFFKDENYLYKHISNLLNNKKYDELKEMLIDNNNFDATFYLNINIYKKMIVSKLLEDEKYDLLGKFIKKAPNIDNYDNKYYTSDELFFSIYLKDNNKEILNKIIKTNPEIKDLIYKKYIDRTINVNYFNEFLDLKNVLKDFITKDIFLNYLNENHKNNFKSFESIPYNIIKNIFNELEFSKIEQYNILKDFKNEDYIDDFLKDNHLDKTIIKNKFLIIGDKEINIDNLMELQTSKINSLLKNYFDDANKNLKEQIIKVFNKNLNTNLTIQDFEKRIETKIGFKNFEEKEFNELLKEQLKLFENENSKKIVDEFEDAFNKTKSMWY